MKQSISKTYAQLIKFGRVLENEQVSSKMAEECPEVIFNLVESIDRQLLWTSVEDFFAVFTPIKKYDDDGTWDYKSTLEMRQEELGTHFGKNDFKRLITKRCFNNKYLPLLGFAYMLSLSNLHKQQTGRNMFTDFIMSNKDTHG